MVPSTTTPLTPRAPRDHLFDRDQILTGAAQQLIRQVTVGSHQAASSRPPITAPRPLEIVSRYATSTHRQGLLDGNHRAAQKARYGGELFPAETAAEPSGTAFLDYFQSDRETGAPKGIVAISLGDLP